MSVRSLHLECVCYRIVLQKDNKPHHNTVYLQVRAVFQFEPMNRCRKTAQPDTLRTINEHGISNESGNVNIFVISSRKLINISSDRRILFKLSHGWINMGVIDSDTQSMSSAIYDMRWAKSLTFIIRNRNIKPTLKNIMGFGCGYTYRLTKLPLYID